MIKPVNILERALARQLRTRTKLAKQGFEIISSDQGVLILRQQRLEGIWRCDGDVLQFSRTEEFQSEFEARTLMAATLYTLSVFDAAGEG